MASPERIAVRQQHPHLVAGDKYEKSLGKTIPLMSSMQLTMRVRSCIAMPMPREM
jgi:hypothetical protein